MGGALLILDDDLDVLKAAKLALAPGFARVETITSPDALETALATGPFDAVPLSRSQREAEQQLDLDLIERHAIERALARSEGNISQAATALGLTRPALYRRMAKHGL